jgi:hypothetical protein
MPPDDTGHLAVPEGGTYVRQRDGGVADLLSESDYPVYARCKICRGWCALLDYGQSEYRHVPVGPDEPGETAETARQGAGVS